MNDWMIDWDDDIGVKLLNGPLNDYCMVLF